MYLRAGVEEMYHVRAIAGYDDRFVSASTHREYAENTFDVSGGCGFSFGNGCSDGADKIAPEEALDNAWAEPVAFDGRYVKGQDHTAQEQPIHSVRKETSSPRPNRPSHPGASL